MFVVHHTLGGMALALFLNACVSNDRSTSEGDEMGEGPYVGPARACGPDGSIDLIEGESLKEDGLGVHGFAVRINGPIGEYRYVESETFAEPQGSGQRLRTGNGDSVIRHRIDGRIRYLFYGVISAYQNDEQRPVIWISGDALTGDESDFRILDRVRTGPIDVSSCDFRYDYGWEHFLPPTEGG